MSCNPARENLNWSLDPWHWHSYSSRRLSCFYRALGPLNMLIILDAALLNSYGNRVKWNAPQNDITYLALAIRCCRGKLTPATGGRSRMEAGRRGIPDTRGYPPEVDAKSRRFLFFLDCLFHFMATPSKVAFAFHPVSHFFMPALNRELCR